MVALTCPNLPSKYVIGPSRVHQNERNNEQSPDQGETLALRRRRGLPNGDFRRDMVTKRFYAPYKYVAVAAPNYLDRRAPLDSPADLKEHNCIRQRLPFDAPTIPWEFENMGESVEVAVDGSLTVDDPHFALNTVLGGAGIGYFPEPFVERFLADHRLRIVLKDWAGHSAGLFLYYPSRRQLPAPLQAFLKFIDGGPA